MNESLRPSRFHQAVTQVTNRHLQGTSESQQFVRTMERALNALDDAADLAEIRGPGSFETSQSLADGNSMAATAVEASRGFTIRMRSLLRRVASGPQSRQASGSMSFFKEIDSLNKEIMNTKAKKLSALVKRTSSVLKDHGINVTRFLIDSTPRRGFADVVLHIEDMISSPRDRWALQHDVDDALDSGWQLDGSASDWFISFSYPPP